jgi:hypothetical protein
MEDSISRSFGMGAYTALASILLALKKKGVLTETEIEDALNSAESALSQHGTDVANGAAGVIQVIRDQIK